MASYEACSTSRLLARTASQANTTVGTRKIPTDAEPTTAATVSRMAVAFAAHRERTRTGTDATTTGTATTARMPAPSLAKSELVPDEQLVAPDEDAPQPDVATSGPNATATPVNPAATTTSRLHRRLDTGSPIQPGPGFAAQPADGAAPLTHDHVAQSCRETFGAAGCYS
jgi:hypothetical protein